MLFSRGISLFALIATFALFTSQAEAQNFQPIQSFAATPGVYSPLASQFPIAGTSQAYQSVVNPQVNFGNACCPTAPTVQPVMPQLPVSSCCNDLGRLHIPRVTTPLRTYVPPIGKTVGRPLFGRWSGF